MMFILQTKSFLMNIFYRHASVIYCHFFLRCIVDRGNTRQENSSDGVGYESDGDDE